MKNRYLTLVTRARMSTLSAIHHYGDTDAEESLQQALKWLNTARDRITWGRDGFIACLENAATHLQIASRTLGHVPMQVSALGVYL